MLLRLHKIALKISFLRPVSIILTMGALVLAVYCLIIDSIFTAGALEPAIVTALWGLLLFAFVQIFQVIPPPVLPHDGFIKKLKTRIQLALYTLLAFVVVATSILLFWMSLRLLFL